jgi:hypothetical protein
VAEWSYREFQSNFDRAVDPAITEEVGIQVEVLVHGPSGRSSTYPGQFGWTLVKTYPELEEFAVSESTPDSPISPTGLKRKIRDQLYHEGRNAKSAETSKIYRCDIWNIFFHLTVVDRYPRYVTS